jgi:hypothetical protein
MKDKFAEAYYILDLHYKEHSAVEINQYEFLVKNFPHCLIEIIAYRAFVLKTLQEMKEHFIPDQFKSWSKSLKGITMFIQNEYTDIKCNDEDSIVIYSAKILGVDLVRLAKELQDLGHLNELSITKFLEEDEIISYNVSEIKEYKKCLVKDLLT